MMFVIASAPLNISLRFTYICPPASRPPGGITGPWARMRSVSRLPSAPWSGCAAASADTTASARRASRVMRAQSSQASAANACPVGTMDIR
uniref:Uncharacterized protein n=1 Tax=Human herpesvirus 1 TaxID=10298 RepID=A0A2Z4GZZ8_HHV1|nr:hypothetical protein [Human alphaherpesvirus 1]